MVSYVNQNIEMIINEQKFNFIHSIQFILQTYNQLYTLNEFETSFTNQVGALLLKKTKDQNWLESITILIKNNYQTNKNNAFYNDIYTAVEKFGHITLDNLNTTSVESVTTPSSISRATIESLDHHAIKKLQNVKRTFKMKSNGISPSFYGLKLIKESDLLKEKYSNENFLFTESKFCGNTWINKTNNTSNYNQHQQIENEKQKILQKRLLHLRDKFKDMDPEIIKLYDNINICEIYYIEHEYFISQMIKILAPEQYYKIRIMEDLNSCLIKVVPNSQSLWTIYSHNHYDEFETSNYIEYYGLTKSFIKATLIAFLFGLEDRFGNTNNLLYTKENGFFNIDFTRLFANYHQISINKVSRYIRKNNIDGIKATILKSINDETKRYDILHGKESRAIYFDIAKVIFYKTSNEKFIKILYELIGDENKMNELKKIYDIFWEICGIYQNNLDGQNIRYHIYNGVKSVHDELKNLIQ